MWLFALASACTVVPAEQDTSEDESSSDTSSDDAASSSGDATSSSDDAESSSDDSASSSDDAPVPTDDFGALDELGARCDVVIGNAPALILHAETRDTGDDIVPPSACGSADDGEDVVFAWTASAAGRYRIAAGGLEHAPLLAVWSDCVDGPLLGCTADEGSAQIDVTLTAGQQIAVMLDDLEPGGEQEFVLQIGALPE